MFSKVRNSQGGFSLVELMVVVAIIGILAAVAVPSVNKYMAKARQSEAKTNLSSIYTGEKAFYSEYGAYHGMFGAIGYAPEGQLRYNVGFTTITSEAGAANGFLTTVVAPGTARTASAYCAAPGAVAMPNGCRMTNGATNVAPPAVPAAGTVSVTAFTAAAIARISSSAGVDDTWTIDNNKIVTNTVDGIR